MTIHIGVIFLFLTLAVLTFQQSSTPKSPCPNVFVYEPPGTEPARWYGVIYLTTDTTLNSLLLNIILDNKADILGNWIGEVSTQDNMNFNIENPDITIKPGSSTSVRFFVQFNPLNSTPKLQIIRFNGKEICNVDTPQPIIESYDEMRAYKIESTTKSRGWADIWPEDASKKPKSQAHPSGTAMKTVDYSMLPYTSSSSSSNDVNFQNVNTGPKGDTQQATPQPTQATQVPARVLDGRVSQYDDDDASDEDTRKDYFDGHLLLQPAA